MALSANLPRRGQRSLRRHARLPSSWVPPIVAIFLVVACRFGVGAVLQTSVPFLATDGSSMLPTIKPGELAIIHGVPTTQLHVGEIVAVSVPADYQRLYNYHPIILHRIVKIYREHGQLRVVTKGDHQQADPAWFPAGDVRGRLDVAIPYAGLPLMFLESRYGLITAGGFGLLFLLYWLASMGIETGIEVRKLAPQGVSAADLEPLLAAVREYGQHLQSHTTVFIEMAKTTTSLRESVATHNAVLSDLQTVVKAMSEAPGLRHPDASHMERSWAAPTAMEGASALPSRKERKRRPGPRRP